MVDKYITVSLPEKLIEKIDNVLKDYGYSSRPEFIKEAIRDKLKSLGRLVEK